jgi:hypothetical protein
MLMKSLQWPRLPELLGKTLSVIDLQIPVPRFERLKIRMPGGQFTLLLPLNKINSLRNGGSNAGAPSSLIHDWRVRGVVSSNLFAVHWCYREIKE